MASDNFTDSNGTALESHDANWTSIGGDYVVTNLEINSNIAEHEGTWDRSGCYYDGSSEDYCQILLKAWDNDAKHVAVRAGASERGYDVNIFDASGGNWTSCYLGKNGAYFGTLENGGGSWSQASDHTLRIVVSGTSTVTIEGWVDGVSQGTDNDSSSPLGTGHPGFWTNQHAVAATSRWDDWTDGVASSSSSSASVSTSASASVSISSSSSSESISVSSSSESVSASSSSSSQSTSLSSSSSSESVSISSSSSSESVSVSSSSSSESTSVSSSSSSQSTSVSSSSSSESTSISSSSSSESTSVSVSSSSSSTSLSQEGWTWGEQNPDPETPVEWSVWKIKETVNDARDSGDWDELQLGSGEQFVSDVKDRGTTGTQYLTLSYDDYSVGSGSGTLYWRGQAATFNYNDDEVSGPTWEVYSPANKSWRYIQLMCVG